MASEPSLSVPIYFVKAILKNVITGSPLWHKLLDDARIAPSLLEDVEGRARVSIEQAARIQAKAMVALNDEMLGYCANPSPVGCWEMMCYACISAETLGDVVERYCKFYNLLGWGFRLDLQEENNTNIYLLSHEDGKILAPYAYELCLHNTHRFFCWIIEQTLPLSRVNLTYPIPSHSSVYRLLFPNTPVFFDQSYSSFEFQRQALSLPVTQNNVSLRKFLRHPIYELMIVAIEAQSWSSKIQKVIGKNVANAPAFENLADQLNIHPQTLRRRLAEESITYRDIKNQLRRDTSIYYLAKPGLSIEDVAERSGFAETSSFIRAFKNWTGLTPHTYRKETYLSSTPPPLDY